MPPATFSTGCLLTMLILSGFGVVGIMAGIAIGALALFGVL